MANDKSVDNQTEQINVSKVELKRIKYNSIIVGFSLAIVALLFAYALFKITNSQEIITVLTALTTIVGTIVGAFLGVHIGSAGKEDAINARNQAVDMQQKAQETANAFAAVAPSDAAKQVLTDLNVFKE